MFRVFRYLAAGALAAAIAQPAAPQSYSCAGAEPDWKLEFDEVQARFWFPAHTDMDVMLQTRALGQSGWPLALTLVGERDTAIVIVEPLTCGASGDHRALVLTQRGETPILLSGCCLAVP